MDTGIDYDHEDLSDNVVWGYDEIDDEPAKADWNDDNGHGTHCAGIVAALENDWGVVGVAPHVDLYGIKVLDSSGHGTNDDVADGIKRAAKGPNGTEGDADDADVISFSLGGTSDDPLMGKSIGQAILEYFLAGGLTMVVQTVVNLIISYIMKAFMNYILPFILWLLSKVTGSSILAAFAVAG
ncbi:MAG: S8 family serine peptidase [Candidatus Korarchaeota archaeon]|nr:S8 family serine peptidase [Candidatus Korarchaeota archaeon]NIU82826.1 S8 family serine peptidase [Candidatus Thorarchaeota archaeon]NIW13312.1 S8 family serine peptidase [Candidatus Thorarchaeota archaeon]NIW51418.1 S8 family serine peptidase [Candidatus Korarchaeota archaeon]